MCSPSRATLLTGRYPGAARSDAHPHPGRPASRPRQLAGRRRRPVRRCSRGPGRAARPGAARLRPRPAPARARSPATSPSFGPRRPASPTCCASAGYEVGYKGKWHLTHPAGGGPLLAGWAASDADRLRRDYGFADWEPPDAGENAKAEHFGAGNAGPLGQGWDEVYTRQVESWLGRADLPEPFCLVVSLVNPHDVLGYPAQHLRRRLSTRASSATSACDLPPTLEEDLRDKPTVHELMKMGMTAYLGPLRGERAKLDYVNFYAHLHRVVDAKIGRLLDALGDPGDPRSLRSRTVIFRCSDHGEMGLSHGGLRQKAFNAYEETIHVPLVVSNPVLFPQPGRDRRPGLADRPPADDRRRVTGAGLERRGRGPRPLADPRRQGRPRGRAPAAAGVDLEPAHRAIPQPAPSVQDEIHFTYDDHQAATALQNVAGPAEPDPRGPHGRGSKFAHLLRPGGKGARPSTRCTTSSAIRTRPATSSTGRRRALRDHRPRAALRAR